MIRIVDKHGIHTVQKVSKHDGTFLRYQAGQPGDAGTMHEFKTLAEAQFFIGKTVVPPQRG